MHPRARMHFLIAQVLTLLPAQMTCLTNYGKTVCGFSCVAAHGEVACARTSAGICDSTSESVLCWDPPEWVRAHYGDHVPRPECITRFGKVACGYRCDAQDRAVGCAASPDGICQATSRGVTCWDPQPSTYCADDRPLPPAHCITQEGIAACGYDCAARDGDLACASTPAGRCTRLPDRILCWDPEPPPMCGWTPCANTAISERSWCTPREKPRR